MGEIKENEIFVYIPLKLPTTLTRFFFPSMPKNKAQPRISSSVHGFFIQTLRIHRQKN